MARWVNGIEVGAPAGRRVSLLERLRETLHLTAGKRVRGLPLTLDEPM